MLALHPSINLEHTKKAGVLRTWGVQARCAHRATHALRQDELVVRRCQGGHHQAEHVQQCATDDKRARAIVVEDNPHDGAQGEEEEELE
jgi:hypothetical protein